MGQIFFASLRLGVFALKSVCLIEWIRFSPVFGNHRTTDLPRRKASVAAEAMDGQEKGKIVDKGRENRQHGNKPYFTRVSLSFSAGNTAATGGNM
jgi:hypothetical protein